MAKSLYSLFDGSPAQGAKYAAQGGSLLRGLARSVKRAQRCYSEKRRKAVRDATGEEAGAMRWNEAAAEFAEAFDRLAQFMARDGAVLAALDLAGQFEREEAAARREFIRRAVAEARARGDGPEGIGGAR